MRIELTDARAANKESPMLRRINILAAGLLAVSLSAHGAEAKDEDVGSSTGPGLTPSGTELCRRVAVTGTGQGYDTAVIELPGQPLGSKKVLDKAWADWKGKAAHQFRALMLTAKGGVFTKKHVSACQKLVVVWPPEFRCTVTAVPCVIVATKRRQLDPEAQKNSSPNIHGPVDQNRADGTAGERRSHKRAQLEAMVRMPSKVQVNRATRQP
jgi:hypothetical protein